MGKMLAAALALLSVMTSMAIAGEITMRANVTFTRDDGSKFVIKRGTTLQYTSTEGLFFVVDGGEEGELLIPERSASEYHRAFSDRWVRERYLAIAESLRAKEILPTHARVMVILERELVEADRDEQLDSMGRKLDELLERESRRKPR